MAGKEILPRDLKKLWESLDLRAVIMFSLCLQAFLFLFAPLRKRTCRSWVIVLVWSAYVLADWVAKLGLGLISSNLNSIESGSTRKANYDADVVVFWAPFLLVHLGGPGTITAFAMEDNEFWNRHLLALVIQSVAAIYTFIQTLPNNQLWIPTIVMFVSGIIKYAERTLSLYRASLDNFRDSVRRDPDPGPNYAKVMHDYRSMREANLPTKIEVVPEPPRGVKSLFRVEQGKLKGEEVVLYAHRFFDNTFKRLIVDLKSSSGERTQSREFFLKRTAEDAFKLIVVELNFMYDVLFTKANVESTHLRFFSLALVVTSFCLFCFEDKKLIPADAAITYALILGAIALDVLSFVRLIFSDWLTVQTGKLVDVNLDDDDDENVKTEEEETSDVVRLLQRRWSEHVSTYNLIFYCLNPREPEKEKILDKFGFSIFFDGVKYVKHRPFTEELRNRIFEELCMKSEMADDLDTAKDVCAAKGECVLRLEGCDPLLRYVVGLDYDQILLSWHIATELCYCEEIAGENPEAKNDYRDFCKLLSDYMLYLLVMQPTLMSSVADIGQIRLRDTCAEAEKFFSGASQYQRKAELRKRHMIRYVFLSIIWLVPSILALIISLFFSMFRRLMRIIWPSNLYRADKMIKQAEKWARRKKYCSPVVYFFPRDKELDEEDQIKACRKIFEVNTEVMPVTIKGDRSKSVFFDGCILAKVLKDPESRGSKDKWEIIGKVWVEMLSHAAARCSAHTHAQLLSKGGELLTLVWLLMAHLGLGEQFQLNEGDTRAKLIVDK